MTHQLTISRKKQFFAATQTISVWLNGEKAGTLENGWQMQVPLPKAPGRLELRSCFGRQSLQLPATGEVEVQTGFKISDREFFLVLALLLICGLVLLLLVWLADINLAALMFPITGFFILRNQKAFFVEIKNKSTV